MLSGLSILCGAYAGDIMKSSSPFSSLSNSHSLFGAIFKIIASILLSIGLKDINGAKPIIASIFLPIALGRIIYLNINLPYFSMKTNKLMNIYLTT